MWHLTWTFIIEKSTIIRTKWKSAPISTNLAKLLTNQDCKFICAMNQVFCALCCKFGTKCTLIKQFLKFVCSPLLYGLTSKLCLEHRYLKCLYLICILNVNNWRFVTDNSNWWCQLFCTYFFNFTFYSRDYD